MNFKKLQFFLLYVGMLLILPSYSQAENIPILSHSKDKIPFNQVIGRALLTNPAINSAKEKLKAEIARSRSLGQALYNPELEFSYENANDTTKTIGISQKIDWQGKRGSNINLGRVRVDIARIQLEITRNSLIADIARSTSNYERNIGLLSLRDRILKSALNLKRFAEKKYT